MIKITGAEGITASVVAASLAQGTGQRMITLEIEFPRFILAEIR